MLNFSMTNYFLNWFKKKASIIHQMVTTKCWVSSNRSQVKQTDLPLRLIFSSLQPRKTWNSTEILARLNQNQSKSHIIFQLCFVCFVWVNQANITIATSYKRVRLKRARSCSAPSISSFPCSLCLNESFIENKEEKSRRKKSRRET